MDIVLRGGFSKWIAALPANNDSAKPPLPWSPMGKASLPTLQGNVAEDYSMTNTYLKHNRS